MEASYRKGEAMYRVLLLCWIACFFSSCKDVSSEPANLAPQRRWAIDSFRYSAYYLALDLSSLTWETRIAHYLELDSQGRFSLLRKADGSPQYFRGTMPDSLLSQIQLAVSTHSGDTTYPFDPLRGYTYDGNRYIVDFYSRQQRHLVQFIPPEAPANIQRLRTALDSFVATARGNAVGGFDLQGYEAEIESLSQRMNTEPLPLVDTVEFTPSPVH